MVNRTISFSAKQLQKKFKHAVDFGVKGNFNSANALKFRNAVQGHVDDAATQVIQGTYRGQDVMHFVNPQTGLNVIRSGGEFLSGWRLSAGQLQNVLTRGSL